MKFNKLAALLLVSLFCSVLYPQSKAVDIPLIVSDQAGGSKQMNIGIDPSATDGLDHSLGEESLPPVPPANAFDVRFELPCTPAEYSLKDYRQGTAGATGHKEYIIQYQPGDGNQIVISWTMPSGITGILQDVITGELIKTPMTGTGSYTVTDPAAYNRMKIRIFYSTLRTNLKLFLEGAFSSGSMTTTLRDNGYLPLSQPYNTDPWNYTGAEKVSSIPSSVVDWILVELRTGTSSDTKAAQRAGFLKNDGTVTDPDGINPLKFEGLPEGSYYIVVIHRNHMSIMSSSAVVLGQSSDLYDFTSSASKSYGVSSMKDLNRDGSVWGMYTGKATPTTVTVGFMDRTAVRNISGFSQMNHYGLPDLNLDGQLNYMDRTMVRANTGVSSKVP